jgi:hypothetical protein
MASYRVPVLENFHWQEPVLEFNTGGTAVATAGNRYIVTTPLAGPFTGFAEHDIAWYDGSSWFNDTPKDYWMCFNADDNKRYVYTTAGGWVVDIASDRLVAADAGDATPGTLDQKIDTNTFEISGADKLALKANAIQPGDLNAAIAGDGIEQNAGDDRLDLDLAAAGGLSLTAFDGSGELQIDPLGVTNAMLAGSIAFTKLADSANIARLDQDETVAGDWTFTTAPETSTIVSGFTTNQLVSKAYVDSVAGGLDPKDSVVAASDTNIDLGVAGDPGAVDGITLSDGDRVLLFGQSTASENGIYIATTVIDPQTWVRADDMATSSSAAGANFFVEEGTDYGDKLMVCTSNVGSDVVGTDSLTFSIYYSAAEISTDGQGIEISSYQISLELDGSTLTKSGTGLKVADQGITETQLHTSVAGNGITGGNGTPLAVVADAIGGANLATVVNVSANGVAVKIDDSSIGVNGSNQLAVKADGITGAMLAPAVAGNGLVQDGSGNLDVNVDDATIEIDTDVVQVKEDGIDETHLDLGSGVDQIDASTFSIDTNLNGDTTYYGTADADATKSIQTAIDNLWKRRARYFAALGVIIFDDADVDPSQTA